MRPRGFLARLGALSLQVGRDIQQILRLLDRTVASWRQLERSETFKQAFELANRSLFFVFVIMAFTGAIMVVQAGAQAQRILGDLSAVGPAYLQLSVREFGPTIVALMISARYGAGVAAELGAMTITEQVDALRMTGAQPPGYLVAPRIMGGVIGMLPIITLGTAISYVAGGLAGHYAFGIGWGTYFNFQLVEYADVWTGVAKAMAFGVAVPLVACYAGLSARGGAPGVGRATTYAVIGGSTAVLFLDLIIGAVGYLGSQG